MKASILIVDDNPVSAEAMTAALDPIGARVTRATDGVDAIARIREQVPDLVITDIEMPRMDGHKLIQWIRSSPDVDSLVIAVTAHSTPQDELEALEGGADEFIAKPIREPILRARVRSLLRLREQMSHLQESIDRYRQAVRELEEQRHEVDQQRRLLEEITVTDELTGIYNRRFLNRRSEEEFAVATRYGTALSCILMDLDHFKRINDRSGHAAGDAVLAEFSRIVKGRLRQGDLFGRWGGEEFMILLPHTAWPESRRLAEDLRRLVAEHDFRFHGSSIRVTASLGVSALPRPGITSVDAFFTSADQALYRAKREGRNRVCGPDDEA